MNCIEKQTEQKNGGNVDHVNKIEKIDDFKKVEYSAFSFEQKLQKLPYKFLSKISIEQNQDRLYILKIIYGNLKESIEFIDTLEQQGNEEIQLKVSQHKETVASMFKTYALQEMIFHHIENTL